MPTPVLLQDRNVQETVLKDFLAMSKAGTLKIDTCVLSPWAY